MATGSQQKNGLDRSRHSTYRRQLDISSGKWSASRMAESHFPAEPTRAVGRIGRRCPGSGNARDSRRREDRPSLALAGQGRTLSPCARADRIRRYGRLADGTGPCIRFKRGDAIEIALGNELPVPAAPQSGAGSTGYRQPNHWLARTPLAPEPRKPSWCRCAMPGRFCVTCGCSAMVRRAPRPVRRASLSGKRASLRRSRRGISDRGLAAARRTGPRSRPASIPRMHDAALHHQRHRPRWIFQSAPMSACRFRFINGLQRNVIAIKIEGYDVRGHGARRPAGRALPGPQRRAWCWRRAPGSTHSSMRQRRPGRHFSILLHDGKEARPIARLVARMSRRSGPRRSPPRRRCRPTACRPNSTSRTPCGSICRSADRKPIGSRPPTSQPLLRRHSAPRPAAPWFWR